MDIGNIAKLFDNLFIVNYLHNSDHVTEQIGWQDAQRKQAQVPAKTVICAITCEKCDIKFSSVIGSTGRFQL